jgi:hypothetical protein
MRIAAGYDQITSREDAHRQPTPKFTRGRVTAAFFGIILLVSFFFISKNTKKTFDPMSSLATETEFDGLGRYIDRDYDLKSPFSSFLPGLAGLWGVPM